MTLKRPRASRKRRRPSSPLTQPSSSPGVKSAAVRSMVKVCAAGVRKVAVGCAAGCGGIWHGALGVRRWRIRVGALGPQSAMAARRMRRARCVAELLIVTAPEVCGGGTGTAMLAPRRRRWGAWRKFASGGVSHRWRLASASESRRGSVGWRGSPLARTLVGSPRRGRERGRTRPWPTRHAWSAARERGGAASGGAQGGRARPTFQRTSTRRDGDEGAR